MAAFKRHCALPFWTGAPLLGDDVRDGAMEQLGRIASSDDLPSRPTLTRYVRDAVRRNEVRAKAPKQPAPRERVARPVPDVPPALASALGRNTTARNFLGALPPSHRREHPEWITQAGTDATRDRRLATTMEWLAEETSRNWKYEKKRA